MYGRMVCVLGFSEFFQLVPDRVALGSLRNFIQAFRL